MCEKTDPGVDIPLSPNGLGVADVRTEVKPDGWSVSPGLTKEIMSSESSERFSSVLELNRSSVLEKSVADLEITMGFAGDSVAEKKVSLEVSSSSVSSGRRGESRPRFPAFGTCLSAAETTTILVAAVRLPCDTGSQARILAGGARACVTGWDRSRGRRSPACTMRVSCRASSTSFRRPSSVSALLPWPSWLVGLFPLRADARCPLAP